MPFEGVELGPLLGKGGYGSVFRGIKHNTAANPSRQMVAIKVDCPAGHHLLNFRTYSHSIQDCQVERPHFCHCVQFNGIV